MAHFFLVEWDSKLLPLILTKRSNMTVSEFHLQDSTHFECDMTDFFRTMLSTTDNTNTNALIIGDGACQRSILHQVNYRKLSIEGIVNESCVMSKTQLLQCTDIPVLETPPILLAQCT